MLVMGSVFKNGLYIYPVKIQWRELNFPLWAVGEEVGRPWGHLWERKA